MESSSHVAPKVQSFASKTEVNWDKLDKSRFYVIGAGLFSGVTVALYPVSVIKTRMQVASQELAEKNAFTVIKNILKTDGMRGFYRGFGTVIIGHVPVRFAYLTSLETMKMFSFHILAPFKLSEPAQAAIANGAGGMSASIISQAIFVPIDVVSQRLMVQGLSGYGKYNGGLDVACKIIKSDGIKGLYRGFGLSIVTYAPSSAVWWATYGSTQRAMWRILGHDNEVKEPPGQWTIASVQASSGLAAGLVASCATTPLDTIKTRIQVIDKGKKETRDVVKSLIDKEGWKGLYRGLGPRFFSMSAWGTSMVLAYEYLKRICVKDGATGDITASS